LELIPGAFYPSEAIEADFSESDQIKPLYMNLDI
jgi:hypothetical protein